MLRAGIVFGGVCVSVCLSARNLENYWSEIDVAPKKRAYFDLLDVKLI